MGHVRLVGFKVADNVENGMVVTETHGDWGGPLIMVCVCVCGDTYKLMIKPLPLSQMIYFCISIST